MRQAVIAVRTAAVLLGISLGVGAQPSSGPLFRDCDDCPDMIAIPAGRFVMGSAPSETGRKDDESPTHEVVLQRPFAVSQYEVTRAEYERFVNETGHDFGNSCSTYENGRWEDRRDRTFRNPGYPQEEGHPVVCISWYDAQAYAAWLTRKTGHSYRLPTEAEWEYATRAGVDASRYWGDEIEAACQYASVYDEVGQRAHGYDWEMHRCTDGFAQTAPVGRFRPNAFGLHDMLGNVWEWVEDCYHDSYAGAPDDGSAWVSDSCVTRVIRGGSWVYIPRSVRSANRGKYAAETRNFYLGFRVSRRL